ncbi:MAG TPA: hypothetical protein VK101_06280 [Limnochordia bacterium]|nr:hypothetical protein [Limnochordia bacterium]
MEKRTIQKEDGRYLIFYAFERPIPKVLEEKGARGDDEPDVPSSAASPEGGED